jgi:two-component system, NarL family, response regulator DegU
VRIFIASADSDFRLALMMLLESEPGMVVTGMSDRCESLPVLVGASEPEVVLLDCRLAKEATSDLIGQLVHLVCPPKIVVLSSDQRAGFSAMAAGADGFVTQNAPPDELLPVLRSMRSSNGAA